MESERPERTSRRFAVLVSLVLIVGVVAYGLLILNGFNRSLEPELERRASLIGATIRDDTERALRLGIPMEELVGVDEYFAVLLADFPEVEYLAIRGTQGQVLAATSANEPDAQQALDQIENGDSTVHTFELTDSGVSVGAVEVGVDRGFVRSKLNDLGLDLLVILTVAIVVAYELTLALSRRMVHRQTPTGSTRLDRGGADVRFVLFLFVIAEELNKSFLPQFTQEADNPITGVDSNLAVSLPIVAYLLTLAIASPFAGRLVIAVGQRRLFLIGLVPAALSHLGMVFADNVVQIVILRGLTGVGYALATIACMEQLLAAFARGTRARTVGVFFTVVMAGTFVGTALGGIFADRMGYDAVFLMSFALVVLAGLVALAMMAPGTAKPGQHADRFSLGDIRAVLKHPPLLALLAGVTIPMNVLAAAFLWYLVPLTMADLGSDTAAIGRTLMVYYLMILLGTPLVGSFADRFGYQRAMAGVGAVLSGVVLLIPANWTTTLAISLAVLVVGISHAAIRGPQLALALEISEGDDTTGHGATLAAVRTMERLGSVVGLLVVAVLATVLDLPAAMGAVGVVVALAGLLYLSAQPKLRRQPVGG
jgi:MFS family permease